MAPPIAAQGYWQTGVRLPVVRSAPVASDHVDGGWDTVCTTRCALRPVALYARSSQPKQMPSSEDVLITKQASSHSSAHGSADGVALLRRQVFTFWDFQCLLNAASQLPSPEAQRPSQTSLATLLQALPSWAWGKWSFRYMTHLKATFRRGARKALDLAN